MQFKKSLLTATLLTVAGLTAVSSANAAVTEGSDFTVSMKVNSVCSVNATNANITFGTLDAGALEDTVGIKSGAAIEVQCSLNAPYMVHLTPSNLGGGDAAVTLGAGTMKGPGADIISYQLYSDDTGETVWGNLVTDGDTVTGNGVAGTGGGLAAGGAAFKPHVVYAKLTSTTDIQLGDYSDTITAKVTY